MLTTPNLRRLSLGQCGKLRELSVCAPALSELILAQCGRLDHRHGNSRLGSLLRLNASCCPELTSEGAVDRRLSNGLGSGYPSREKLKSASVWLLRPYLNPRLSLPEQAWSKIYADLASESRASIFRPC